MPTYLYECDLCEGAFEIKHSLKEVKKTCSVCGEETLRRVPVTNKYGKIDLSEKGHRINEFLEREIKMDQESAKRIKRELSEREL